MKKILFIIRDFKQGGIPRCLQSLLAWLPTQDYEIDLLCLYQNGPYRNEMPNCKVMAQDPILRHLLEFGQNLKPWQSPVTFAFKFADKLMQRIPATRDNTLMHRRLRKIAGNCGGRYDAVIAYSEGIAAQVAEMIDCPNRFVWIHNDYAFDCARGDQGTSFEEFARIICVSKATEKSFVEKYPQYKIKTTVIYNIINDDFILKSAKEGSSPELCEDFFNIISVGRICYQKNFVIIPSIIASLPADIQKRIRWNILGDGPEDEVKALEDRIAEYGLEKQCVILGNRDNPYPYIMNSNLFVLTSKYESYPTVINEAIVLGTPIISIDIPPAYEMLDVSRIHSEDSIAKAICKEFYQHTISDNKKSIKSHNNEVILQFNNLINCTL